MPRIRRAKDEREARRRAAACAPDELIPVAHKKGPNDPSQLRAVSYAQRLEYRLRLKRYRENYPDYISLFGRPPRSIADKAWKVVEDALTDYPETKEAAEKAIYDPRDERSGQARGWEARLTFLIILGLLVGEDDTPHAVTFNDVFDAVCCKFSDHYLQNPIRRARDMLPVRVQNARRDLLLQFIDLAELWRFLMRSWRPRSGNPFYTLTRIGWEEYDPDEQEEAGSREMWRATAKPSPEVTKFRDLARRYGLLTRHPGIRLKFDEPAEKPDRNQPAIERETDASTPLPSPDTVSPSSPDSINQQETEALLSADKLAQSDGPSASAASPKLFVDLPKRLDARYCAEVPYNEVRLEDKSKRVIALQAGARLVFDAGAFMDDFKNVSQELERLKIQLANKGVDHTLSNEPRRKKNTKTERNAILATANSNNIARGETGVTAPHLALPNNVTTAPQAIAALGGSISAKLGSDAVGNRIEGGGRAGQGATAARERDAEGGHNSHRSYSRAQEDEEIWSQRLAHVYFRSIEQEIIKPSPVTDQIRQMAVEKIAKKPELWEERPAMFIKWLERRVARKKSAFDTLEKANLYTSQDLAEAAVAGYKWRFDVHKLLAGYDRAQQFLSNFRAVRDQLVDNEETLPEPLIISSDFYRNINRRYQPTHMWPTYVSKKVIGEQELMGSDTKTENKSEDSDIDTATGEDGLEKSYRKRWFKALHPESRKPIPLVGIDVSSSQTQIVATFLGCPTLERDTMELSNTIPFKTRLAQMAWDEHEKAPLLRMPTLVNASDADRYNGPDDPKLQELCKSLWMMISYGSTAYYVVHKQASDPQTYGPGWTVKNASCFLKKINDRYPDMRAFLNACRFVAKEVVRTAPATGLKFTDPFDLSQNVWNPIERSDRPIDVGDSKVILSLPIGMSLNSDFIGRTEYPVDQGALRRMLPPCFVHMLDAYYSSLMMERLAQRGVTNFVAIHDCWLVPEFVMDKGRDGRGEDVLAKGGEVIRRVFQDVAQEWYRGLEPAYLALLQHLKEPEPSSSENRNHKAHRKFIEKAYERWKQRKEEGYVPKFLVKED